MALRHQLRLASLWLTLGLFLAAAYAVLAGPDRPLAARFALWAASPLVGIGWFWFGRAARTSGLIRRATRRPWELPLTLLAQFALGLVALLDLGPTANVCLTLTGAALYFIAGVVSERRPRTPRISPERTQP